MGIQRSLLSARRVESASLSDKQWSEIVILRHPVATSRSDNLLDDMLDITLIEAQSLEKVVDMAQVNQQRKTAVILTIDHHNWILEGLGLRGPSQNSWHVGQALHHIQQLHLDSNRPWQLRGLPQEWRESDCGTTSELHPYVSMSSPCRLIYGISAYDCICVYNIHLYTGIYRCGCACPHKVYRWSYLCLFIDLGGMEICQKAAELLSDSNKKNMHFYYASSA